MTYQAIAFDLDGTLLNSQGAILASSKKAIQQAIKKNIKVILVTGRHHTAVKPYYNELNLDTPIICCNGTYIYQPQNDEILISNPLSKIQAEKVINIANQYDIHLLLYSRNTMNYIKSNPHIEKLLKWIQNYPENIRPDIKHIDNFQSLLTQNEVIWKFVISHPDRQIMEKAIAQLPATEFSCEWSWSDRIDIANNGNTKGGRLLDLLKHWQIAPQNVIAFGDNHNDTSMLTAVGLGVAMGNAEEEVKQQAKRVTLSNDENGIEKILNEIL